MLAETAFSRAFLENSQAREWHRYDVNPLHPVTHTTHDAALEAWTVTLQTHGEARRRRGTAVRDATVTRCGYAEPTTNCCPIWPDYREGLPYSGAASRTPRIPDA
jgi:hypothetical protein